MKVSRLEEDSSREGNAYHDSILKRHTSQHQRLEKLWRMRTIRLRVRRRSSRGQLGWGEVWSAFGCLIHYVLPTDVLLGGFEDGMMLRHNGC